MRMRTRNRRTSNRGARNQTRNQEAFARYGIRHLLIGATWVLAGAIFIPSLAALQVDPDTIRWEPYQLRVGDDSTQTVELGRLSVPERRGTSNGRAIELAFVRLPARTPHPGEPIVYLDGGPGGSGVGAAEIPAYYRLFDALREVGDVILLSQRGTGLSAPRLACPLSSPLPDDLFTTRQRLLNQLEPEVVACAETWRRRGADLAGYTTRESADDLEDLRVALGTERLNLLAFSYGTHLAIEAIRRHGSAIRRAVLLGTEGPDHTLKLPSTMDVQLRRLARLAARDSSARRATPDLYASVDSLLRRLDRDPLSLTVTRSDGRRGPLLLGGDGMRYLLRRDIGDTNDLGIWPAAIRLTLDGDHRLITSLAGRRFRELAGVPLMGLLMDCASGATEERLTRIRRESQESITGSMTNTWFPEVCQALPEARLEPAFRTRFASEVPTLFLSGSLDANTPPHQAQYASWGWTDATHLVVDHAGHESVMPLLAAQEAIVDFLDGEDVSNRSLTAPTLDFTSVEAARTLIPAP